MLATVGVRGKAASKTCYLCYCCYTDTDNNRDEEGGRSNGAANMSMADDSLYDIGYNRPPGARSNNSSENSSARQSHDVQGGIVVTGAGDEVSLTAHPLLGGQTFDPDADTERDDSSARRCCILKVGRASIRISLGLAVWVFALAAALSPKSSGIIVLTNSLNGVFLGIIAPA